MRKINVLEFGSLDGVIQAPGGTSRPALLHTKRSRRGHILPFDEQFSLGAAGVRQRDLECFDRR